MSSMLEQAIIDASALKEAAIKNAESEVLEKYSSEIKDAVGKLLEQEELDLGESPEEEVVSEEEVPGDADLSEADEEIVEDIPSAATASESEIVEIDLNEIIAQLEGSGEEVAPADVVDRAELAEDVESEAEVRNLEEDEEIELSETDLVDLVEKFIFDQETSPNGYVSSNTMEVDEAAEVQRIQRELEENNEELNESISKLRKNNNKLKRVVLQLKEKLDDMTISNARLLYINRALNSASLNERQKVRIVETISKAQTAEEAKIIYETLQSTVQSKTGKSKPESLNEVTNRRPSIFYSRSQQNGVKSNDPALERMQRLAGIKKGGN
jgi:hypothetical protein